MTDEPEKNFKWAQTKKQKLAWQYLNDNKTTEIFYGGGAGGGKSYLGCMWIIISCLKYPGSRWMMGRAILKSLKQTTLLTFLDICKKNNLRPGKDFEYRSMDGMIHWNNDSEIYLKDLFQFPSDPEYDSLGSTEFTGAFIDEGSQVTNKAKMIVMSRLRYKLEEFNLIPKLLIASNPAKNFLYSEFYRPYKEKKIEPYRAFIPSLVTDNPYISPHYIENLKKLDKTTKERLLYGNFEYDDDPSKLMEYDAIVDLFTNAGVMTEDKYLTCDPARMGHDKTVIMLWGGYVVTKVWEFKKQKTDITEEILLKIAARENVSKHHIVTDDDGVGGGVVDHVKCKGFINNATPVKKPNENYANLKSQCYFYMADAINKGKVAIHTEDIETKAMIIEELEQIKRRDIDKDGKLAVIQKEIIKEKIGRSPDFADCIMMRFYFDVHKANIGILKDLENVTGLF